MKSEADLTSHMLFHRSVEGTLSGSGQETTTFNNFRNLQPQGTLAESVHAAHVSFRAAGAFVFLRRWCLARFLRTLSAYGIVIRDPHFAPRKLLRSDRLLGRNRVARANERSINQPPARSSKFIRVVDLWIKIAISGTAPMAVRFVCSYDCLTGRQR